VPGLGNPLRQLGFASLDLYDVHRDGVLKPYVRDRRGRL